MKTNKSFTKRLKVAKKGKIIARKSGRNHFNAKQSRTKQLAARKGKAFSLKAKDKGRYMPHN